MYDEFTYKYILYIYILIMYTSIYYLVKKNKTKKQFFINDEYCNFTPSSTEIYRE